jgi:hypothetical protein
MLDHHGFMGVTQILEDENNIMHNIYLSLKVK